MSAEVRWVTAFLDTAQEHAEQVESFWCQVTGYRPHPIGPVESLAPVGYTRSPPASKP